jgi:hypothetical protein
MLSGGTQHDAQRESIGEVVDFCFTSSQHLFNSFIIVYSSNIGAKLRFANIMLGKVFYILFKMKINSLSTPLNKSDIEGSTT